MQYIISAIFYIRKVNKYNSIAHSYEQVIKADMHMCPGSITAVCIPKQLHLRSSDTWGALGTSNAHHLTTVNFQFYCYTQVCNAKISKIQIHNQHVNSTSDTRSQYSCFHFTDYINLQCTLRQLWLVFPHPSILNANYHWLHFQVLASSSKR